MPELRLPTRQPRPRVIDTGRLATQRGVEPLVALEFDYGPGQSGWVVSHEAALDYLPAGHFDIGARIAPGGVPDINGTARFDTGRATISTPTYSIIDVDDGLTRFINSKFANGLALMNSTVREYEFGPGTGKVGLGAPIATSLAESHAYSDAGGVITVTCADPNRGLQSDVFAPLKWRLLSTISAASTSIPTTLSPLLIPNYQATFAHTLDYPVDPGKTIGYVRIETTGEIFSYTGFEDVDGIATFVGVRRGALQTVPLEVKVAADVAENNRAAMSEWVLLSEEATDLARALIIGKTWDGRTLPAHWTAGSDAKFLDDASFAANAGTFRFFFQNPGREKLKSFLESEVLVPSRAVLTVGGDGALRWTPAIRPGTEESDAGGFRLSPENCVGTGALELRHNTSNIHPAIRASTAWDARAEKFLDVVTYVDEDSVAAHKTRKTRDLEFRGIQPGVHTATQTQRLLVAIGDESFYETQDLVVESFENGRALGSLVTADFPSVYDDAKKFAGPLLRTMMIVGAQRNRASQTTTYTLSGTLQIEATRDRGRRLHNLEIAEYKRGGRNIATLPGISINNNIASGSITLAMGEKYYYVNDASPGVGLEFGPTLNVAISGTGAAPQLWIFGRFDCRCTIDLSGRSRFAGGAGATASSAAQPGTSGYLFNARAGGGLAADKLYAGSLSSDVEVFNHFGRYRYTNLPAPEPTEGRFARIPEIALDTNNGKLGGFPADLSGTSGGGGAASFVRDRDRRPRTPSDTAQPNPSVTTIPGFPGARGGGSLVIVSWSGSITGRIDTSGSAPAQVPSNGTVTGGSGAPGMPGGVLWIVDGFHTPPVYTGTTRHAYPGNVNSAGEAIEDGIGGLRTVRSINEPTTRTNLWQEATRVAYTPEPETVEATPVGEDTVEAFFALQRDGRVRLHRSVARPGNADLGDLWVAPEQMASDTLTPVADLLTPDGWRRFVWGTEPFEHVYASLIAYARAYNTEEVIYSAERPALAPAGTYWIDSRTGAEWILQDPPTPDILVRELGVPVGENLLNAISAAQAESAFLFTRDADLQPINTLKVVVEQLKRAFISLGTLEGEYGVPGEDDEDGQATYGDPITHVVRIAASTDDAEQSNGTVSVVSSDLELGEAGTGAQQVGLRFAGPALGGDVQRVAVDQAWIQFTADESHSDASSLLIRIEAGDDPSAFTTNQNDISDRPLDGQAVAWSPGPWVAGDAGAQQQTPELAALVQSAMDRPGWSGGNALVFVITGSGTRTAESFEGDAAKAPELHIVYRESTDAGSSGPGGTTTIDPPRSVTAQADSPTSITVDWDPPVDQSNVSGFELKLDGTRIAVVTAGPYRIVGLDPETTYQVGIRSQSANPAIPRSDSVDRTVTTPADTNAPSEERGITLTDTGRRVAGIARQSGSTVLIGRGREIRLELADGWKTIETVGDNGYFEFNVPSSKDDQLGKEAGLYTNNGSDATRATLDFIYERD